VKKEKGELHRILKKKRPPSAGDAASRSQKNFRKQKRRPELAKKQEEGGNSEIKGAVDFVFKGDRHKASKEGWKHYLRGRGNAGAKKG